MKLPRDISGLEISKSLHVLGYQTNRQTGSHFRLTTIELGEHHITIPNQDVLKIGTLNSILTSIASHFQTSKEELLKLLKL